MGKNTAVDLGVLDSSIALPHAKEEEDSDKLLTSVNLSFPTYKMGGITNSLRRAAARHSGLVGVRGLSPGLGPVLGAQPAEMKLRWRRGPPRQTGQPSTGVEGL